MSDSEFTILDIKKRLVAHDLYKPAMTIIEMEQVYYSFLCKQAIEAEGLYENGMSDQDIKDIYDTLKKSEESAGNDKEYNEILNRTETNCANIDMLVEESNSNVNEETVDVTSIQPASPKPLRVSKTFSSAFKTKIDKQPIKNLNVLMDVKAYHPTLKLQHVDYSNASLIYYHQTRILKLPLKERSTAISQYLLNLHKNQKNDASSRIKWSSPILPQQKKPFNGDLCVDFIPDLPEEILEEKVDEPESPVKDNHYISNRPKRVVKRKNYIDQITDDEDDFTASKKTKNNDELKLSNEQSPESKWLKRKKKTPKAPLYLSTGSDRINKIFDQLKWGDSSNSKTDKKSAAQSLQDTLNLSDTDEEVFPERELVTTANIHKEEDQAVKNKNAKAVKAKKASPKKRAVYNKLATQKNSATKENESPEIPTHNFYEKNKNADVDESNNNKLEKNEELTNCPICNRPFPASKIEIHAATCMQYEGNNDSETICDICFEQIPDKKLRNHRYECLKKITEASVVAEKPVTRRSQRNNGFLCEVCDKYICNTSEIQHASNCIAKV